LKIRDIRIRTPSGQRGHIKLHYFSFQCTPERLMETASRAATFGSSDAGFENPAELNQRGSLMKKVTLALVLATAALAIAGQIRNPSNPLTLNGRMLPVTSSIIPVPECPPHCGIEK
jgi:hypothetical protein